MKTEPIKKFYTDWEEAQKSIREANNLGYDAVLIYDPNNKGWSATFRTVKYA